MKQHVNMSNVLRHIESVGRVWHHGLILKLEKYGIHGNLLAWFENYLLNRSQSICDDNTYSSK